MPSSKPRIVSLDQSVTGSDASAEPRSDVRAERGKASVGNELALVDRVLAVLDLIRPAVQADGGDIEFVALTAGGEVQIRFLGACVGCPSSAITLQTGIERNLRMRVPEVTGVVAVP